MKGSEILIRARSLIADESHWCRGSYAMDADGSAVGVRDKRATRFCAAGAFDRACRTLAAVSRDYTIKLAALPEEVAHNLFGRGLVGVNDDLGHEAVLRVYDAAISQMQEEEARWPA